jgi:hypothetical protein
MKRLVRPRRGVALEATLYAMLLISVVIALAINSVVMVQRVSGLDYRGARVNYAAEAGSDAVMSQMEHFLDDGSISDSELATLTPPAMSGFVYDNISATKTGSTKPQQITDGPYAGLYALVTNYDIRSQVHDVAGNRGGAIVSVKAQAIPIFQFGIFFEKDLEILNGPPMEFDGWVHSNGNIYLSSAASAFHDAITTPNKVFHDRKDRHDVLNGVTIDNDAGTANALTFDSRSITGAAAFRAASHAAFDDRLKTDAYGVDSLKLPLPTGVTPAELIAPRNAGDDDVLRKAKFAWKADWYIEVPSSAVLTNALCAGGMIPSGASVRAGGKALPDPVNCAAIFKHSQFWDGREGRRVDAIDIDMQALFAWAGVSGSNATQILYVTVQGWKNQGIGTFHAIRLVNGSLLATPITVATNLPLYVKGDYNTNLDWRASALVGDAITILSNAWNDAAHTSKNVTTAAPTAVYAAILAGHSPTACDWVLCGTNDYGGGLENFPRFLENWSGKVFTYRGSLVSMHFSAQTFGSWGGTWGSYYSPPVRDWKFDTRFSDPSNLPPGTPVVGSIVQTAYRPAY